MRIRLNGEVYAIALVFSFAVITAAFIMRSGADFNWDLRNYHLYNGYAFVNNRLNIDITPAGLHSFINPLLDVPFYFVLSKFGIYLAHILLCLYYIVFVLCVYILNRNLFSSESGTKSGVFRAVLSLSAAFIGVTGAAALGQAVTTMNEVQIATLVVAALIFVVPPGRGGERPLWHAAVAGGLVGIAVGLKLTAMVYLIGMVAALVAMKWTTRVVRRLLAFGSGVALGLLIALGPWSWSLYARFDSPLFPFYNSVFRSSWAPLTNVSDNRFLPQTFADAALYPIHWAFSEDGAVSEVPLRDPRLLLLVLACVVFAVLCGLRRAGGSFRFILVFGVVSYAVWLWRFSILRYAIPLEVVSGTLLVGSLLEIHKEGMLRGWLVAVLSLGLSAFLWGYSTRPNWGRLPFESAYAISAPNIPDNSTILLVGAPIAYVAALMPDRNFRFIGVEPWMLASVRNRDLARAALDQSGQGVWAIVLRQTGQMPLVGELGRRVVEEECVPFPVSSDSASVVLCPVVKARSQ